MATYWENSCSFDLRNVFMVRGWVRKFCHRWCNFVNRHDKLLYYTLIERATFRLYNHAKIMSERNKYSEIDALKEINTLK